MIFSAWVIRSGPASTARGTTWQRIKVCMASSQSWSSLGGSVACGPLSRSCVPRPLKDEHPALTHHANFTACDYNIELIFKSWKSYLHVARLKTTKEDTTLCYLYGRMLLILLNYALCPQLRATLWMKRRRELSLLKLVRHFQALAEPWMQALFQSEIDLRRFLQRACTTAERLVVKASRKRRTTAQSLRESLTKPNEAVACMDAVNA
jgi:hypothetical protein